MKRHAKHIRSLPFKLLLLLLTSCLDPYKPPVSKEVVDALVVDGFINTTNNSVTVKLSHTLALADNTAYPPEKNATVTVEGEDGSSYNLIQREAGNYGLSTINLNTTKKYRLRIRLPKEEYLSDYITLKQPPPLDNLYWEPSANGINIYADTHDPSGKTRYYEWLFSETWEYNADFYSAFKYENGKVLNRPFEESIYVCWKTEASTKILIESTTRLTSDVVHHFPITFVPKGSKRLSRKYSILVQLRALDEASYNYLSQLQKTTENLGGLFDPMPTQVTGNLHNVKDPSEPVLGYFRGGGMQQKRIFVNPSELPRELLVSYFTPCTLDSVKIADLKDRATGNLLIDSYGMEFPVGYRVTSFSCADCRVSGGGVTTKPDFWP